MILSPRDLEIFKLLNRYRYLRSSTIISFFAKKDRTYLSRRLADLYHEQPYLGRFDTRARLPNADHQDDVYELTPLSRQALKSNGIVACPVDLQAGSMGESRHFQHCLMICDILSSIELGCIENGLRFVTLGEILAKAPRKECKLPVPLEGKEYTVVPDGLFGIQYQNGHRFFALEADRGTEPLTRANLQQTSYRKKLLLYRAIVANNLHQVHWGVPNLHVLNVTTSAERMENIRSLIYEITNKRGNSVLLLKTYKGTPFSAPPADGHMLNEPWQRAAYGPFNIGVGQQAERAASVFADLLG